MKTRHNIIYMSLLLTLGSLTACMDNHDEPAAGEQPVTSQTSVGTTNTTIAKVKQLYCSDGNTAAVKRNASNYYTPVTEDLILEGVIVANDWGGNLYQTLVLRDINATTGDDQCIQLSIKNTCLYPYFQLGQRLKINLNGLYVGCYSNVAKIGQPYWTSLGNRNLGPMLLELCRTNIELVGKPNRYAPEMTPVEVSDSWLASSANRTYTNCPMLATVTGSIAEVQGAAADTPERGTKSNDLEPLPKVFGPEALYDDGYAVNRHINLQGNSTQVTLRTGTDNPISFTVIPRDVRSYTGMLTYYGSEWQLQLRSVDDIYPAID